MSARFGHRAWGFALALLVALAALAGCMRTRTRSRDADWATHWSRYARNGPRWRVGTEFVLAVHEDRPEGVRTTRERFVLIRRDSLEGVFERVREQGRPSLVTLAFHPRGPKVPIGFGGRVRGRYPVSDGFVPVTVPAGRFRSVRTWRDREESDGRVMRIDEWWSPGVPFAVQSWTRWEGVADTLHEPPRREAQMRVGTRWVVLESVRHP